MEIEKRGEQDTLQGEELRCFTMEKSFAWTNNGEVTFKNGIRASHLQ